MDSPFHSPEETQAWLAAIVESSDDAIISKTLDGIITTWNRSAERILGHSAAEAIGKPILMVIPQDRRQEEVEILQRLRRGERIDHFETVRFTKDGRLLEVSLTISPIKDRSGRITGASKIMRDITRQKQAERELEAAKKAAEAAKEKAEAASRAKEQFLSALSHELRTPLTPVLATLSELELRSDVPLAVRSDIEVARRNVEVEARLIDDLLDLTRLRRGEINLHFEVVDAEAIVQICLDNHRTQIAAKRLSVSFDRTATKYHVWADPVRLQQIISNLISNAVKFSSPLGRITVRIFNHPNGSQRFTLQITDTGVGIEAEKLSKIFDAFDQGERREARQFGGLGLGLTISKLLTEMHGGTISATSAGQNRGSTFTLGLETISADTLKAAGSDDIPPAPAEDESQPLRCILLVEDHQDTLTALARLLKSFGYAVTPASCVKEAMELMDQQKFDLLISDIGLPDGTGLDVVRASKAKGASVHAIALSGYGLDEDLRRSKEAGFELHLTKPVNFQRLKRVLEALESGGVLSEDY